MSTSSVFNSRAWKKAHLKTCLTLIATQCRLTRPCHLHVKCRNYFSMRDSFVQYKDSHFHVEMSRFDCALLMLASLCSDSLADEPSFLRQAYSIEQTGLTLNWRNWLQALQATLFILLLNSCHRTRHLVYMLSRSETRRLNVHPTQSNFMNLKWKIWTKEPTNISFLDCIGEYN